MGDTDVITVRLAGRPPLVPRVPFVEPGSGLAPFWDRRLDAIQLFANLAILHPSQWRRPVAHHVA